MKRTFTFTCLLAVMILAAGCSAMGPTPAPAQPEPTQDLGVVRTEAAKTVIADLTKNAPAQPEATATQPPVATETPTATPFVELTATPTFPPTATAIVMGVVKPLPTKTPIGSDFAQLLSTSPADGTTLAPGEPFDAVWKFKNTGKKVWDSAHYYYKYVSGAEMHTNGSMGNFGSTVGMGEEVEIVVDMKAPDQPGVYTTYWTLMNDNGEGFYRFYVTIVVQ